MSDGLKPCPCCGERLVLDDAWLRENDEKLWIHAKADQICVLGGVEVVEDTIDEWNRCAPWLPPELVERIQTLHAENLSCACDNCREFVEALTRDILAALADPRTPEQQEPE